MDADLKSLFQKVSAGELEARAALKLINAARSERAIDLMIKPDTLAENLLFYRPVWMEERLCVVEQIAPKGNVLLFARNDHLFRALKGIAAPDRGVFEARPGEIGAMREVLARLRSDDSSPLCVIHSWNVDQGSSSSLLTADECSTNSHAVW